ncbi:O-methyltransferase [Alloscardovia venturai]|uniref:O-methyltransferase n=1 Tax=Alloscardovia venturai TaxID=1769421 RepID=A0ABW2Y7M9_9BIFI
MNSTMYSQISSAWKFIEETSYDFDDALSTKIRQTAEHDAHESGIISSSQAHFIRLQARLMHARTTLIIGVGSGMEIPALADGMNHEGQITVVTSSAQVSQRTRDIFDAIDETSSTKLRCVNADAQVFLPRLNAHDYDMILVSSLPHNYEAAVSDAQRLLRSGGILILTDVMALMSPDCKGGVPNAADRSEKAVTMRTIIKELMESNAYDTSLISVGTGLLLAVTH